MGITEQKTLETEHPDVYEYLQGFGCFDYNEGDYAEQRTARSYLSAMCDLEKRIEAWDQNGREDLDKKQQTFYYVAVEFLKMGVASDSNY